MGQFQESFRLRAIDRAAWLAYQHECRAYGRAHCECEQAPCRCRIMGPQEYDPLLTGEIRSRRNGVIQAIRANRPALVVDGARRCHAFGVKFFLGGRRTGLWS